MNLRTERACSLSSTQRMVLRGLINFPSAPLGEAILLQSKEPACGSRRGGRCRSQALSYGRRRGSVRVRNGQARKPVPPVVRGAAVIRAHRARLRKSRERNGMVASAPRVDMGPGPPATACRKCRTATSHDELPYRSACVTVGSAGCSALIKIGCAHFRFSVYTCRSNGFAHTPKRALL